MIQYIIQNLKHCRVTRMEPTADGAEHAGVLRETNDLRRRGRARYGDRGYAETNGGARRYRTMSTRQVSTSTKSNMDDSNKDDMPGSNPQRSTSYETYYMAI